MPLQGMRPATEDDAARLPLRVFQHRGQRGDGCSVGRRPVQGVQHQHQPAAAEHLPQSAER